MKLSGSLYTLRVDNHPVKEDISGEQLETLLREYGVSSKASLDALMEGESIRVLGQDLELVNKWQAQLQDLFNESEAKPEKPPSKEQSASNSVYNEALSVLEARSKSLSQKAKVALGGAVLVGVFGIAFYLLGAMAMPSAAIDQIHVPEVVSEAFASSETEQEMTSLYSLFFDILTSTAMQVVGAVAICFALFIGMARQSLFPMLPAIVIMTAPTLVSTLFEDAGQFTEWTENNFELALEENDLERLQAALNSRDDVDQLARDYVLAQGAIRWGARSESVAAAAEHLRDENNVRALKAEPSTIYAIEMTAHFGDVNSLSEATARYRETALKKASDHKRNGFWALVLAGLFVCLGGLYGTFAAVINRRVLRIGQLLTQIRGSIA